jgi:hypothetical protein
MPASVLLLRSLEESWPVEGFLSATQHVCISVEYMLCLRNHSVIVAVGLSLDDADRVRSGLIVTPAASRTDGVCGSARSERYYEEGIDPHIGGLFETETGNE